LSLFVLIDKSNWLNKFVVFHPDALIHFPLSSRLSLSKAPAMSSWRLSSGENTTPLIGQPISKIRISPRPLSSGSTRHLVDMHRSSLSCHLICLLSKLSPPIYWKTKTKNFTFCGTRMGKYPVASCRSVSVGSK
jgi:hypothetical protein